MQLLGQLAIGRLDLRIAGSGREPEYVIWIAHGAPLSCGLRKESLKPRAAHIRIG